MRTGPVLLMCCCAFLACGASGRADDDTPSPEDSPDMMPGSVASESFLSKPKPSPAAIEAEKEEKAQAEANSDWMLKGYEKQLQERTAEEEKADAAAAPENKSADAASTTPDQNTGLPPAKNSSNVSGEPDKSPGAPSGTDSSASANTGTNNPLAPIITPLSTAASLNLKYFDFGPSSTSSIFSTSSAPAAPDASVDSEDMDVPGMTAVDRSPEGKEERDLNLDLLPGEDPAQAAQDRNLDLQLPTASATQQLQTQENSALVAPGYKKPVPVARPLVPPPSDTSDMVHDPIPVRVHIADPYDILQQ